ncbi:MAG: hypothetical protein JXR96_29850 [Deltaproteobacteria bacterium]|nr:hypothetical protein [Deltaproteobacteria bacterium]
MRASSLILCCCLLTLAGAGAGLSSCTDEGVGQPCTFSWPVKICPEGKGYCCDGTKGGTGSPGGTADKGCCVNACGENGAGECDGAEECPEYTDCRKLPQCHPLEETLGEEPARDACPIDCVQLLSLECTNLICVATQVDEGLDAYMHMNGRCAADVVRTECLGESDSDIGQAAFGCQGYCSKECLSDASCPKGYRCAPMAPFGENMRCEDEAAWGGGEGDTTETQCTEDCIAVGDVSGDVECFSTDQETPPYELCDFKEYAKCCACICYRYCPLLSKSYCRKIEWDESMFGDSEVIESEAENCRQTED